jgi:hypothetical protein
MRKGFDLRFLLVRQNKSSLAKENYILLFIFSTGNVKEVNLSEVQGDNQENCGRIQTIRD